MERSSPSGISILIVGGGLAGLACAIESHRKGHDVRVFERRPNYDEHGGMINVGSSAMHTPEKWPGFLQELRKHCYAPISYMYKHNGELICEGPVGQPGYPSLPITRGILQRSLYDFCRKLEIPVDFGVYVEQYYETGEKGGVVISGGRKVEADVVIAADGVGSKSWNLVTAQKDTLTTSGYSIYQATFPIGPALENPIISKELRDFRSRISVHVGPDIHIVIGKTETDISWYITYKDNEFSESSGRGFSETVPLEKALEHVHGWSAFVTELISFTPSKVATKWKVLWRNPQSKWASPKGRLIQIGDAAHSFIPTSNSGATMAWEDAFSIAACLGLGGKDNIPHAVRVHNLLRFERTACAQKTGFKNRERLHRSDWDNVAEKSPNIGKFVGDWLLNHDAEQYVYDCYEKASSHIINGTPFKNTNSVPGYTFKPWDIFELTEASSRGEVIEDDGDWN